MILVTGGTGLLGSRLLFDLTSHGKKVRAIKRCTSNLETVRRVFSYYSDNPGELFFRIEWVDGDILDIDSLMEAMNDISYVYHAAAAVSFDPDNREKIMKNNIDGTRNVVNASLAKAVKKICHVSSTSALGNPDPDGLIRENSLFTSDGIKSAYSVSKYKSELEVWKGIEEGLRAVIVNPSMILGPGFWDRGSSAMFSVIHRGFNFYTNGMTGFVSVEDVSAAMIALMKSHYSGERFILSSENLSYREVFNMVADSLGRRRPSIEANLFLANLILQLDELKAFFGGRKLLTREEILASQNRACFSNEKFCNTFNAEFLPVRETINNIGKVFRRDIREGWLDKKAKKWGQPGKRIKNQR